MLQHWKNKSLHDIEGEVWKPIGGFEGRYEISNKGRVKTLGSSHFTGHNTITFKQKIRSISLDTDGYCFINLSNKKDFPRKVHRLVAEAFVPNPDNLPTVNHIDFDKTNNDSTNLNWKTELDNYYYSVENGRMKNNGKNLPDLRIKSMRPVIKFNLNGDIIDEYGSLTEAAVKNNLDIGNIWSVLNGRGKTCGGFKWIYKTKI